MTIEQLAVARTRLQAALTSLEEAHKTWSECVTSLHMSEIALKSAGKNTRLAFDALCDVLNHR